MPLVKKKFLRANHALLMIKSLRKAIGNVAFNVAQQLQ